MRADKVSVGDRIIGNETVGGPWGVVSAVEPRTVMEKKLNPETRKMEETGKVSRRTVAFTFEGQPHKLNLDIDDEIQVERATAAA